MELVMEMAMSAREHMCLFVCLCVYVCACLCLNLCVCVCVCVCMCVCVSACERARVRVCLYAHLGCAYLGDFQWRACVCLSVCVCASACTCECVCSTTPPPLSLSFSPLPPRPPLTRFIILLAFSIPPFLFLPPPLPLLLPPLLSLPIPPPVSPNAMPFQLYRDGLDGTPHYSMTARRYPLKPFNNPGPGRYKPESGFPCSIHPTAPSYSLRDRTKLRQLDRTPGQCRSVKERKGLSPKA